MPVARRRIPAKKAVRKHTWKAAYPKNGRRPAADEAETRTRA